MRQRKTRTVWHQLYVESKEAQLIKTEENGGCQGLGVRKWGDVSQRAQTSSYKRISSGDLMFSMVLIINNTVLNIWKLPKSLDLKFSHHKKETIIAWSDGSVNQCYCGNHFEKHKCIKSKCCTP